jgi:DNA-binding CsgD family transcriptional regulator/tetratricopeptide (TPR) repeat protein
MPRSAGDAMISIMASASAGPSSVGPSSVGSALIGRDRDLESARTALAEAANGSTRTLLIGGEAGIGKTRLVSEFVAGLSDDVLVVHGQCLDFDRDAPPYGPLASVLRQFLEVCGADAFVQAAGPTYDAITVLLPELAQPESGHTPSDDSLQSGRGRLYSAIAAVFEGIARLRSTVVIIEDLHWSDRATLDVLRFLLKVIDGSPILFLVTFRTDELAPGHPLRTWLPELERNRRVTRTDLGRLSRAQVKKMIAASWGDLPTRTEIDLIFSRSDGVPFFVEELADGGREAAMRTAFPVTLRGILLARYDALEDGAQRLLRVIAAGGERVEHQLLLHVMEGDERSIDTAARQAVAADVLVVDGTAYAFRHALMREAIHDQLLPGERVRFHTRYAQALSERGLDSPVDAGHISYHWMAAHNLRNAFTASLTAMQQAKDSYATQAAARMGERALELWESVPDASHLAGRSRVELLSDTAYILRNAGESERALALIDEALAEDAHEHGTSASPQRRAEMLRNKASFLANLGRAGSVELLREALGMLADGSATVLRANVLGELAARLMLEARFDEAVETADRAFTEALTVDSATRMSVAANIRGFSLLCLGKITEGLDDLARAGELALGGTDSARLRYWVNQSDALNLLGRFEDAARVAREGVEAATRRGVERTSGAILASNVIAPLYALGRSEHANELLDAALELDPPIGFSAPLRRLKLRATLWGGDVDGAAQLLHRWQGALDRQRRIDAQSDRGLACIVAEIALERDDPRQAWRASSVLLEPGRRSFAAYDLPLLAVAARALTALPHEALEHAARVSAEARLRAILESMMWWPTADVYAAVFDAELGGNTHAGGDPSLWEHAVTATSQAGATAQLLPYASYRLAIALLGRSDRAGALTQARAALERGQRIGYGLIVRRVRELLDSAGLADDAASDVSSHSTIAHLTDRERQVLALLTEGLTNREIAQRLYISVKTASVHVSNILRKTGTSSRTQAAYLTRHRTP